MSHSLSHTHSLTHTHTHIYSQLIRHHHHITGANMVIPETAADPFPGIRGRAVDWLRRLRQANYSVVMTCVHASKNKCMEQGRGREGKEGKKYNNMSWSWAMSKVDQYFNYARELGYTRETFFVFDNSDWSNRNVLRVPPHHDLRLQLMYTDMGDTVGGFSTLPMRNINFARMNATLPPASVSLAWHEYVGSRCRSARTSLSLSLSLSPFSSLFFSLSLTHIPTHLFSSLRSTHSTVYKLILSTTNQVLHKIGKRHI
jgi:hypothetical protein